MRLCTRVSFVAAFLCALVCFIAANGFAQTNRGGIRGTVTASNGRLIPGASVTITNAGTNEVYHLKTSAQGAYSLENLDPVVYRVEIEAPGFEKGIIEQVKVDTASIATANVTLHPGNFATQVVKVTAESALVNSENGTLGTTISERMLTDLPMQNRSVLDLAVTTPNISGDVGSEDPSTQITVPVPGFNLSINGGRPGTSEMLADGVSNTGVGLAREVVAFSPETVQELNVQTSAFSAQYGSTGGGIIQVTTKSGTNQFHGIASWYNRNPMFNANPWSNATSNLPRNNIRWNQGSFDIGGPVWIPHIYNGHDKTFFFFAFEPRWQSDKAQVVALLPDANMRSGNFSGLDALQNGWAPAGIAAALGVPSSAINQNSTTIYQQYQTVSDPSCPASTPQCEFQQLPTPPSGQTYQPFANNTIPANMLDPVVQKLITYWPAAPATPTSCSPGNCGPYFLDSNGYVENWAAYRFVNDNHHRWMTRIDEILSQKDRLSFRFTDVPEIGTSWNGANPTNGNSASYSSSRQYVGAYTRTLTPTIYNDLRLNYTTGRFSGSFTSQYDINNGDNLSRDLGLPSLTHGGLPLVIFDQPGGGTNLNSGADIGSENSQLNDNTEKQVQLADNLYITHGNMTWTMGVLASHDSLNVVNFYAAAGGRYDFRFAQTDSNGGGDRASGIGFASFLLGVPNDISLKDSLIPYRYRWNNTAAFLQNDWKIRPNLTLNLGVRYFVQVPRTEESNYQGVFLPTLAQSVAVPAANQKITVGGQTILIPSINVPAFGFSGIGGNPSNLTPTNHLDFEPRFGFAYGPRWWGMREWVIRGGYGISHLPYTGQNRQPNPDFSAGTLTWGPTTGQANSNYITRLAYDPPYDPPLTPAAAVNAPQSGFVLQQSINEPGFALSSNSSTPYVQNWDLSIERQLGASMMFEAAYSGAKGTHLFFPGININPYNPTWVATMVANNVNPGTTRVLDPLGRTSQPSCKPSSSGPVCTPGSVRLDTVGSLSTNFVGFDGFLTYYDAGADSIRHAVYVNLMSHATHGLTMLANYTYSKSIDDASTAAPDKNVLVTSNLPGGQITYGGTPRGDRSLSTFDVTHDINGSFIYDLPIGRHRQFLANAPLFVDETIGGWTVSGVERVFSGFPTVATEATTFLSPNTYATHDIRPYAVPGVPLKNPDFNPNCVNSNLCQPYVNPAAFMETPTGGLGTSPRTLNLRGPWQQNLDLSLQKNFRISERWRLQLRADALNLLNHPLFRTPYGNGGGAGSQGLDVFGGEPPQTVINASLFNQWAAYNNLPPCSPSNCTGSDPGATTYKGIVTMFNAQRLPSGALPTTFYTIPMPQGFALTNANAFDIRTLTGYKEYRVRQDYGGNNFGQLYYTNNERYMQFALRLFF